MKSGGWAYILRGMWVGPAFVDLWVGPAFCGFVVFEMALDMGDAFSSLSLTLPVEYTFYTFTCSAL